MRIAVAVVCCTLPLAACGGEAPTASGPKGPMLLARAGDTLLAVDTGSGRIRRTPAGAHDLGWRGVYTARAGHSTTVVTATDPATGKRLRSTEVDGHWAIPIAAGTTPEGAVSGDGRWLVLEGPAAAGKSEFALLPTAFTGAPKRFRLRGRFDFDALAPDGSAIFLSQIERSGRYRVRAYDIVRDRLRPQVVVDKTAVGQIMQGVPVARAVDPTGSPVHTLYRGGPEGAFVHSLNTARGTALCIFLPRSRKDGPRWRLRLDEPSTKLHAMNAGLRSHFLIDTTTGEVADAPAGTPAPGTRLADYAVSPDGELTAGERRIGDIAAEAELLAVR